MNGMTLFFLLLTIPGFSQSIFTNPLLPSGADPWRFTRTEIIITPTHLAIVLTSGKQKILQTLTGQNVKRYRLLLLALPIRKKYGRGNTFHPPQMVRYFAADDGKNDNHRLYVLESVSQSVRRKMDV